LIAAVSALAGLLFGFDTGVISGALPYMADSFGITPEQYALEEFIVSAVTAGALAGAAMSGLFARVLGRRRSIMLTAALFTAGTAVTVSAQGPGAVIAGRLIMGFAVGLSAMVVPMYLSEVSPPRVRGAVVFVFQLAITLGLLSAFAVNYAFAGIENWRLMFAVGFAPALLLGAGMLGLPSSPRWLASRGRSAEAGRVLVRLLGREEAAAELREIEKSVSMPKARFSELFGRRLFPLVAVCFGLFAFQQLCGINTVFYYAPILFEGAGFGSGRGAILASVATGTVNVLATVLGIWLVDRLGRRKLLFVGFIGMVACLGLLGVVLEDGHGGRPWVALAGVTAFIVFFAVSLGGVPYVLMSELFPMRARAAGMAVASCANWGFNFLVSATFLSLAHSLGMGNTFLLYAALTLCGLVFAWLLVPETKGVRLEDIEADLYAGKPVRRLGRSPGG
jgi:sugar porter (SP) family MFS transporter